MALATGTHEINVYTVLERIVCGGCGLNYAVDARWLNERRNDGLGFRCPNGCERVYRETEADRLKKRLEQSQRWEREAAEQLQAERTAHSATKGKVTKLRNRAEKGVCSTCGRTFANYARHQADVHGVENGWPHKK